MKKTHHHFSIIFAVLVTLFVASLYCYTKYSTNNMARMIVEDKIRVVTMQSNSSMNTRLKELSANSSEEWNKLYEIFIQADNTVPFIEALESLGTSVGSEVSITTIDNTKPKEGSLAKNGYINAKVIAHGSWSAILKTLMLAENMPYKVSINNVQFNLSSGDEKTKAEWSISFNISATKSIQ